MQRISLIAFTNAGCELALEVRVALEERGFSVDLSGPARFAADFDIESYGSLSTWTAERFATKDALVFVGASGIAVRAIAPFVRDKFSDPAVVSIDEAGRFAVPLLSGHVGGANELARLLADSIGATPVISTATDVEGRFAVDEWAREMGLVIVERMLAKEVSASLIDGRKIGFSSDFPYDGDLPDGLSEDAFGECELGILVSLDTVQSPYERTLHLVPRAVNLGVGCRRGTPAATIARQVEAAFSGRGIGLFALAAIASIDLKEDEQGLEDFAESLKLPLRFFSAEELGAVEGEFTPSDFVEKTVGVDNVCERAAVALGGRLVVPKTAGEGVTVAASLVEPHLAFPDGAASAEAGAGN